MSLVKNMINVFESFSYNNPNNEVSKLSKVHRTKSLGSLNSGFRRPRERRPEPSANLELLQIEQQINHLADNLNNYQTYNRESHIYHQNQIFFLLTDIIQIETKNNPDFINKKSELIEILKRLNTGLNARLPSSAVETNSNYVELPPPVMKYLKKPEENKVNYVKKPEEIKVNYVNKIEEKKITQQDSVDSVFDQEEEARQVSVKSLKKLWEKNISENEKKIKENQGAKTTQTSAKLPTKYIPFSERNREDSMSIPETNADMYEESAEVRNFFSLESTEGNPEVMTPDSLSDKSESDDDTEIYVNGDGEEDA